MSKKIDPRSSDQPPLPDPYRLGCTCTHSCVSAPRSRRPTPTDDTP